MALSVQFPGQREISIDLSGSGDLTVLDATNTVAIKCIYLTGETSAANCTITLRKEVQTTGPVIYVVEASVAAATRLHETVNLDAPLTIVRGLFLNVANAWSANSRLIIYTA